MENIVNKLRRIASESVQELDKPICSKHGKPIHYQKNLETGEIYCPVCKLEKLNEVKIQELQEKMFQRSYRNYLKENSLVDRKSTFNYCFDSFDYKPGSIEELTYQQARQLAGFYYKNPNKTGNSLLFGNAGSGKTHLAMSILNAVNSSSKDPMQKCLFLSATALFKALKAYMADSVTNKWSTDYATKIVSGADLVVIDDLGAESVGKEATAFVQTTLQDIYEANQRIITTTNLTMDELQATYHDRLVSRFLEGSQGKLIDFTNVDDKRMWQ